MTSPDPSPFPAWRIACLGATAAGAAALAATVSSIMPAAAVEELDLRVTSSEPEADVLVVDAVSDPARAIEQLRILRGRGSDAPALLVGRATLAVPASLGECHAVDAAAMPTALPNVIEAVARMRAQSAADPGLALLIAGLRDTRQRIAAGEIARMVKHDLNNPLAALLAEAQLLELEDLSDEARESAARIVELARRVIDEARRLEGPRVMPG